jgi:hypothetical protein
MCPIKRKKDKERERCEFVAFMIFYDILSKKYDMQQHCQQYFLPSIFLPRPLPDIPTNDEATVSVARFTLSLAILPFRLIICAGKNTRRGRSVPAIFPFFYVEVLL